MTYFKTLVKELATDKTVRAAQIERLTLKGKFAEASKVFVDVAQAILRDTGTTKFKLLERGNAKNRKYSIIYELIFSVEGNVDAKSIESSAKEFLGSEIKFTLYIDKGKLVNMYVEIPLEI